MKKCRLKTRLDYSTLGYYWAITGQIFKLKRKELFVYAKEGRPPPKKKNRSWVGVPLTVPSPVYAPVKPIKHQEAALDWIKSE